MINDQSVFCCPRCKGELNRNAESYRCPACETTFPVVLGIPDFRLFPDPYISFEDDWRKGERLFDKASNCSFDELVEYYWEITPTTPAHLARNFIRYAREGVNRGEKVLEEIDRFYATAVRPRQKQALDLGCGTAGFLLASRHRFQKLMGIDIAFRWLIVARKRIEEAGAENIDLLCCCAEFLPFREKRFDLVVASDLLEHCARPDAVFSEAHRVLNPGQAFYFSTTNRFTLTSEVHVKVWGVGFLPRKWMGKFVRTIKGIPYNHIRSLSLFEIKRSLKKVSFQMCKIGAPAMNLTQSTSYSRAEKFQVALYNKVRKVPLFNKMLCLFGPFISGLCVKSSASG